MSFAEEFGHDIPPDDWDGGGRRSRYKHKPTNYFTGTNPLHTKIDKSFFGVKTETSKAYLVLFAQGLAWVPKSKVDIDVDSLKITLPFWLYSRLEFIKDE